MNEYYECENCGQVVQGYNASRQVECCDSPSYKPLEETECSCQFDGDRRILHDDLCPVHGHPDEYRPGYTPEWTLV